jgi:WD40 repeat protein
LLDLAGGKEFKIPSHDRVSALAFSPDGKLLAIAGQGGEWLEDLKILLVNVEDRSIRHVLRGHESLISDLAFLPDGSRLVSGSWDHTVKLWDVALGQSLLTLPMGAKVEDRVERVLLSPDGSRIAASNSGNTVVVWKAR